jgi:hypothetical protein
VADILNKKLSDDELKAWSDIFDLNVKFNIRAKEKEILEEIKKEMEK